MRARRVVGLATVGFVLVGLPGVFAETSGRADPRPDNDVARLLDAMPVSVEVLDDAGYVVWQERDGTSRRMELSAVDAPNAAEQDPLAPYRERVRRPDDRQPSPEASSENDAVPGPSAGQTVPSEPRTADEQREDLAAQGLANGHLPRDALDDAAETCVLIAPAARAWEALVAKALEQGVELGWSGCYRSYEGQVQARARWCNLGACGKAARPGTSMHGLGIAVDVSVTDRALEYSDPEYRWLMEHGPDHGWHAPEWAHASGSNPEPWHWEYYGPLD